MTETERCNATVVLYPEEECIIYACSLPKGHDGTVDPLERWHLSQEDEAAWKGHDAETLEYQDV